MLSTLHHSAKTRSHSHIRNDPLNLSKTDISRMPICQEGDCYCTGPVPGIADCIRKVTSREGTIFLSTSALPTLSQLNQHVNVLLCFRRLSKWPPKYRQPCADRTKPPIIMLMSSANLDKTDRCRKYGNLLRSVSI